MTIIMRALRRHMWRFTFFAVALNTVPACSRSWVFSRRLSSLSPRSTTRSMFCAIMPRTSSTCRCSCEIWSPVRPLLQLRIISAMTQPKSLSSSCSCAVHARDDKLPSKKRCFIKKRQVKDWCMLASGSVAQI
uniref:Putative secreted protein n=1 Tax=Amblyomma americanum TaxID=6943 RepID=A0A0C9SDJ5_AMBAM